MNLDSRDSSVVRVLDLWLKDHRFKSLQERRENFLLQGQLSVLLSGSHSTQKCRWQVTVKHKCSLRMWLCMKWHGFAWSDMVHGCMVYTERTKMAAVSCGTSHVSVVSKPIQWIYILKMHYKKLVSVVEVYARAVSAENSAIYKSEQQLLYRRWWHTQKNKKMKHPRAVLSASFPSCPAGIWGGHWGLC